MSESAEIANLMASRSYEAAVPLLEQELAKYPKNVRLRLQYADALAGLNRLEESLDEYYKTAKAYEDSGLIVQAIGVRKKAEKLQEKLQNLASSIDDNRNPRFDGPMPKSPLFENLSEEELNAVVPEMALEEKDEGDVILSEGDEGSSLFVIVRGEVKVYTHDKDGASIYLAKLTEGDFFGEISLLTGRRRTATITAASKTELLRLDKDKFDSMVQVHPRIRTILEEFCEKRANHTVEAMIETLKGKR